MSHGEPTTSPTDAHGLALPGMIGEDAAMLEVYALGRSAAATDAPVVLIGETGTGKELVARAIHELSVRREGPFVAVNAAAIPDGTFEAEVFGHEKGAFTGAGRPRKGYLRQADGGTFFLDEALELAAHHQPKLLRAIETGNVLPVGSDCEVHADFRTIGAAQADAWARRADGRFRADLWYRLAVLEIVVPPLRARLSDLPLLADAFLCQMQNGAAPTLTDEALVRLCAHPWSGNVRELRGTMQRLAVLHRGERVTAAIVDRVLDATHLGFDSRTDDRERSLLANALRDAGGETTRAAKLLGMSRSQFYRRLHTLGIPTPKRHRYSHRCE